MFLLVGCSGTQEDETLQKEIKQEDLSKVLSVSLEGKSGLIEHLNDSANILDSLSLSTEKSVAKSEVSVKYFQTLKELQGKKFYNQYNLYKTNDKGVLDFYSGVILHTRGEGDALLTSITSQITDLTTESDLEAKKNLFGQWTVNTDYTANFTADLQEADDAKVSVFFNFPNDFVYHFQVGKTIDVNVPVKIDIQGYDSKTVELKISQINNAIFVYCDGKMIYFKNTF
ncbi:MAG: hypothetical protein C4K58_07180 [Flavobacteriaceae bacterium]|nr:MAG: hypothetical protein C4K58_07180 [Flavobacteriaceae bacterium]